MSSHNERYKTYQTGFSFGRLGHAPGVGFGGTVGGFGGGQIFFPQIQPDLVCGLGEGPKGQISLNLNNKVKFKAF